MVSASVMSDRDFKRLGAFIYDQCGIKISPAKKPMLEARLQRRLRGLSLKSFGEYCDYLFGPRGMEEELVRMIDLVTTNKTDFFREPSHFDYLRENCLSELVDAGRAGFRKKLTVWSAGCSTGEEPYTLAMVLSEFAETHPGFQYTVIATDISTRVLATAALGVYETDRIGPVPLAMKKKYLLKSRDKSNGLVRITPELRAHVKFRRLNFMDGDFGLREPVDIIFCRNVIIYFDKPTQENLLHRFHRHLAPGGYIFLGHSETLFGMDVPLVQAAPTIYRKPRGGGHMGADKGGGTFGPATGNPRTAEVAETTPTGETLAQVYLRPGERHFAENPTLVTTVLGSCVSVTMHSRRLAAGAICHALLPEGNGEKDTVGFRYVDSSIRRMVGWFDRLGVRRRDIEVKLFGGADLLKVAATCAGNATVGHSNIEMAIKTIESEKLRLLASDVGGNAGRKLYFYSHTGEVLVRRIPDGSAHAR